MAAGEHGLYGDSPGEMRPGANQLFLNWKAVALILAQSEGALRFSDVLVKSSYCYCQLLKASGITFEVKICQETAELFSPAE